VIILIAPYLIYCGYIYNNIYLIVLGIIFMIYEIFWIIFYKPKTIDFNFESYNID
jgi:hypothetical protein